MRVMGFINKVPTLVLNPGTRQEKQVPPTRIGLALNPPNTNR